MVFISAAFFVEVEEVGDAFTLLTHGMRNDRLLLA